MKQLESVRVSVQINDDEPIISHFTKDWLTTLHREHRIDEQGKEQPQTEAYARY
jgi:hypothetical protein